MKQLLRYTSSLLRSTLLLGALAILNIPAQAQTAAQWAEMPDAFETMDPASIIGDGNYYYIQFYNIGHTICSYMTDCGAEKIARTKDFLPYANNRLWTLESVGVENQFKLRSKTGRYVGVKRFENANGDRYGCVDNPNEAAVLTFNTNGDGYEISQANYTTHAMYRVGAGEWAILANIEKNNINSRLRFAKLKSTAAFIIYYRGEHTDGNDNSSANAATTRHYLTYSGTGNEKPTRDGYFRDSEVSSRKSIIPSDKPLCTLPTLAAYHQDGLWTLEGTGADGQFYIKKYGSTDEYLNLVQYGSDGFRTGVLGVKDNLYGNYTLVDRDANRYSLIQNVKYNETSLAANMFYNWNGYGAGAAHSSETPVTIDFKVNEELGSAATVAGPLYGAVNYLDYADLTNYSKMVIRGSQNMQLRVLMNRQESNSGYYVERDVTIGSDGTAVVDLTGCTVGQGTVKMTYTNADAPDTSAGEVSEAKCGYNKISSNGDVNLAMPSYGRNYLAYLQVDVSAIKGTIKRVSLTGDVQQITDRVLEYGVGYSDIEWSSTMTWNTASRAITRLGGALPVGTSTEDKNLTFDITGAFTDSKVKTILLYCLKFGGGYIKNPKIYVEYEPDDASTRYVHLNAIKTGWSSPNGTVNSINLLSETTGNTYYLHHAKGDGWQLMEWTGTDNDYFNAGFYPVEVPVPNKDNYFEVLLQLKSNTSLMVNHDGGPIAYSEDSDKRKLFQLEQVDNYLQFRLKTPTGQYLRPYPDPGGVTEPNDPTNADIITNIQLVEEKFNIKWFYVDPLAVPKEIPVNYMVTHKVSYLQDYAQAGLGKQGLATDADSDWWNYGKNESDPLRGTQKTNHFEITHYVKMGNSITVEFPTVLNKNNDHIYYQRFYHYNDETCDNDLYPDGTDIAGLKDHVSLDTRDDGDVQYFLYQNGMVTGQKLDWTGVEDGGYARNVLRRFNFTNSDGEAFTVAADVSRYSDLTYKGNGDLEEPSLTMRYLYYMKDAKEMAKDLTGYTEESTISDRTTWLEEGTVCIDDTKWMETKEFHFPATPLPYENEKWAGYRGEFIGLRHVFSDYWVFNDGDPNSTDDNNLVSAVNNSYGGKIEVRIYDPNNTGIRLGGWNPNLDLKQKNDEGNDADYQGFYFYDKMYNKTSYGDSRFIVFRYPKDSEGKVTAVTNTDKEAYIHVYLNNNGTRYQLAQFTVIFDENSDTRPWTSVKGSRKVEGTDRDPSKLRNVAGRPIAKITFDYPESTSYHFPSKGETKQGWYVASANATLEGSSPIPLKFDNTNYAFSGFECNWGSYAIVSDMSTNYGNHQNAKPADAATNGYNIEPDEGLQRAFLYIDASEQPGDICSADFQGEFCAGDKLMCSGWISGSNKMGGTDYRCPGGITLTVKGERIEDGKKETIYRFCPGQCYELDDGPNDPDGSGLDTRTTLGKDSEGNDIPNLDCDNNLYNVVWQQFYFEFGTTQKYKRYWMEVNNNCVSSNGGDFMLDNVEVFALVPEVIPEMNTPVCISKDVSEMSLLKLNIGFDKILAATNSTEVTEGTGVKKDISFVFLKKDLFLATFLEELNKSPLNYGLANVGELEKKIEKGEYENLMTNSDYKAAYKKAFDAAILGDYTKVWDSDPSSPNNANVTAAVLNYHWSTKFTEMETYSFAKAVNGLGSVFRETDTGSGERFIVINGNYPNKLPWKTDTEYYVIPYNSKVESITEALYEDFNLCSACCKKTEFHLNPSIQIISMEASDVTEELVVCEGKIPTLLTNLKGYNINGDAVPLTNLNFDWWLGSETTLATLDNYHKQENTTKTARLDEALYILRLYYPEVTSLDGVVPRSQTNTTQTSYHQGRNDPELTQDMIDYLKSLVDAGQLILHQKSISVPAEKANGEADPYFYLVACPIHDGYFEKALNPAANKYVAYFCDEPQGLRIKVGEKAPTLKCGFVPNENGFTSYDYTSVNDAVLSIRLAKKAQFEEVQHGTVDDKPSDTYNTTAENSKHFLWLPIRNAEVESTEATGVIRKSGDSNENNNDYNVYLASTDDPVWDQSIYTAMSQTVASLPIVGKIVKLTAVDTKGSTSVDQTSNRLCIYFTENFDVREGYSYTLSLPYKENSGDNACDGTILINVKIVPDYEVWTGGAGNTDWNNDQNWRRADGNSNPRLNAADELYVGAAADGSPLKGYKSNDLNYRTDNDRVFRKGFAPLYCTHVLMKSDEWGNAPELYDALDGADSFSASPFPNLRDTSTPILKFDMQARKWDIWEETYGVGSRTEGKGRAGDLLAEMYQINTCDEIVFQPATELRNAHLLNYNNAWMEYKLDMGRWYLLGSALQGTIAGEWYAPTGTAQQKTTYYDAVTFGTGYDRYSPAIYQRSWDKAKAVLYEVGSTYDPADNPNDLALTDGKLPGSIQQGTWSGNSWDISGADSYLDRLGYKPLGNKKVNVAIKGIWSNTYNDATVDYTKGGFSVMVLNNLKGGSNANPAIIRLPKEDTWYDYYGFDRTGADNPNQYEDIGTNTQLSDVRTLNRAKNRGRLKTDLLLPESTQKQEKEANSYRYGDRHTYTRIPIKEADLQAMNNTFKVQGNTPATAGFFPEPVSAGISNLGYYLVENPFPCGMNMDQFFETNTGLEKKYWLLTATGQHLVQKASSGDWIEQVGNNFVTANAVVTPGQGFFVQATTAGDATTITFNKAMQAQSRYGVKDYNNGTDYTIVVGTKQKMTTKTETVTTDSGTEQVTIEVPEVDSDGNYVIEDITENVTVYSYVQTTETDKQYALKARTRSGEKDSPLGLVITAQRGDSQSSALVMLREGASNDFLPEEDTETFISSEDLKNVPMVYTLCGRLATTINSIHDFSCLPLGVESASDAPCTLTFHGVEMLGDSIAFYDAVEQKLTPLKSGMQFAVSGQTQNRYYLVRSLDQKEAAEETHIQIFTKGLVATVIASTAEPITNVRCFDTAGRLVYSASPQMAEYSFNLPAAGIYIIEAQTEADHKTKKVMTK